MMQLMESLEWCLEIGIHCVSIYAFSIENFKRSEEEVVTLMQLAEAKLTELIQVNSCCFGTTYAWSQWPPPGEKRSPLNAALQEHALVEQYGVQVRVIGDLTLLPAPVQTAAEKVMDATRTNTRTILNICLAYTCDASL